MFRETHTSRSILLYDVTLFGGWPPSVLCVVVWRPVEVTTRQVSVLGTSADELVEAKWLTL